MAEARRRQPDGQTGESPTAASNAKDRSAGRHGIRLAVLAAVVSLIVAATHWPALSARALSHDDFYYVTNNRLVQNPGWDSASTFVREVLEPSTVPGYYQPLAMISLMLDYAMGGRPDNPRQFHRTSLLLHVLNTALVVVLLNTLFGRLRTAAVVGLLFGLHPLTVEAIPWLGERKTLLAAFFALCSIACYVRWTRRRGVFLYIGCLVGYLFAVLSKPTSTPLPLLLLLLDCWPLQRLSRRAVFEKLPLLAIGAASAVVTVISQGRTSVLTVPTDTGPVRTALVICHNIVFYLRKIAWPVDLTSHYPIPNPLDTTNPDVLIGVVGTGVLAAVLLISLRRTRALAVGWLFFFVAIFPTLGLLGFTNVIAADKYAYLPFFGLLMIAAWSINHLWNWLGHRRARTPWTIAAALVLILTLCGEVRATRRQLHYWRTTETLFSHMAELAPNAPMVCWYLGGELYKNGKLDEAVEQYRHCVEIEPDSYQGRVNLAARLEEQGKAEEAVKQYNEALRSNPNYLVAHANLGRILAASGNVEEALPHLRSAVKIAPNSVEARNNLGIVLARLGRMAEAETEFRAVVLLNPKYGSAHYNLAMALEANGLRDEAIYEYRQTIKAEPGYAEAHYFLGCALHDRGDLEEAASALRDAVRLMPSHAPARKRLERVTAQLRARSAESLSGKDSR